MASLVSIDSSAQPCGGSAFGDCCNWAGKCGSCITYCGPESCDPAYGNCGSSTVPAPVSTDDTCSSHSDPDGAARLVLEIRSEIVVLSGDIVEV